MCSERTSRQLRPVDQQQGHGQIQRGDRAPWVPQEGTSAPDPGGGLREEGGRGEHLWGLQ